MWNFHSAVNRPSVEHTVFVSKLRASWISRLFGCLVAITSIAWSGLGPVEAQQTGQGALKSIDFGLEIRPILSEHCFHCHGPDAAHRQADLRLDEEASSKLEREGKRAVAAGSPEQSEILRRIESHDPDLVMPPPSARKTVTPQQRDLLKRWIQEGAAWGNHWSLEPPRRRAPPEFPKDAWAKSPIDAWVLESMKRQGLSPAPSADPYTLVRRLWLDLVGLHPERPRVERFIAEYQLDRNRAIESMVEELLIHPGFGEHWGRLWLDLARYADTKGYEKDLTRDLWPYRDWVIHALNDDMPYDQFTVEQLAGDLLESPTMAQRIATAFHRTTLSNDEGGTDDEEFRIAAVKDRVDTTLQVWMGLTMGCAKCHSHKYDPIAIEDYYKFYAIFNQTEDADRYDDEPKLSIPSDLQQAELESLQKQRQERVADLDRIRGESQSAIDAKWTIAQAVSATAESQVGLVIEPDRSIRALADRPATDVYQLEFELPPGRYQVLKLDAMMAKVQAQDASERLGLNAADPNFVINELQVVVKTIDGSETKERKIALGPLKASFEQNSWPLKGAVDEDPKTGWAVSPKQKQAHWGIFEFAEAIELKPTDRVGISIVQSYGNHLMLHRFRVSLSQEKEDLALEDVQDVKLAAGKLQELDKQIQGLMGTIPKLPILKELAGAAQRKTRVHKRGSFLDPGDEVPPALLPLFDAGGSRDGLTDVKLDQAPDRLSAARWIVSPSNPLTARVAVNRVWAQLFGRGMVETEEDFGATGSLPSHPELLDTLAMEYRDSMRWSLKSLLRSIVLSNTYQQAYVFDELRAQRDPRNVWLSRAPHFRLSAEVIRDQALGASGLLSTKLGGPPVMPPQPEGLWRSTYSGAKWVTSPGQDRFRRGIYTFWKRTTPYPSMELFDATTREVCQIRRITTNTPLQALVTLNDPVYVEASIAMAIRWLAQTQSPIDRISQGFAAAMVRPIEASELDRFEKLLDRAREYFHQNPDSARALLANYPESIDPTIDVQELAAWSMLTSALLNLDEFLTRP